MNDATVRRRLGRLYDLLLSHYGPQGWWPTTPAGGQRPRYFPGLSGRRLGPSEQWEIAVGAVLTQNTAWRNAEQALVSLHARGVCGPRQLLQMSPEALAAAVRSSGYYNQKAARLRGLATHLETRYDGRAERWLQRPARELRAELLDLRGIGPETADCILLYGAGYPFFVIDAFTRRICWRLGLVDEAVKYADLQDLFTRSLPRDVALYNEYHALLVRHAVEHCRARPRCADCPLRRSCTRARQQGSGPHCNHPTLEG